MRWPWTPNFPQTFPGDQPPQRCRHAPARPAATLRCWRFPARLRCCCSAHWHRALRRTKPRGACWPACWSRRSIIGCAASGNWPMRCIVASARSAGGAGFCSQCNRRCCRRWNCRPRWTASSSARARRCACSTPSASMACASRWPLKWRKRRATSQAVCSKPGMIVWPVSPRITALPWQVR
ncbi:hypothetical protein D3C76_1142940 [compost metagenome]